MVGFVRSLAGLIDRPTKRRLLLAGGWSLLLALLEAVGLALVAPLLLVLNAAATHQAIPSSAAQIGTLIGGHPSAGRLAAWLGVMIFAAFLVKSTIAVVVLRWNIGVVLQNEATTARRLLAAYLRAPYSFHLTRNSADLQRTVHESVRTVYEDALTALVAAQADAVVMATVLVVLCVLEPAMAAASVLYFTCVAIGYQRIIHGRVDSAARAVHDDWRRSFQIVQQSLRATKELAIVHRQDRFVRELESTKRRMADRQRTLILIFQLPRYYLELALILGFGGIGALLFSTRSTNAAIAGLGLFLAAGFRLLPSLNRVLVAISSARSALPAMNQIERDLALLETAGTPVEPYDGSEPMVFDQLRVEGVTFVYPESKATVLRDISLTVTAGRSVGFVGTSGAGKTTLLDLILGLLPPTSGCITVNGRVLGDVVDRWQRSIGFVPQDVTLIDDSLLLNIALGEDPEEVDRTAVDRAVAMAQLEDLVSELPEGLATGVGEDGVRLSGGQRQRVGIARALYNAPSVLVLDEATSALDSHTEALITRTLEALRGQLTILIVAHRLSTIRRCDEICFLSEGRLAAQGSFEELVDSSAAFAELVRLADVRGRASG